MFAFGGPGLQGRCLAPRISPNQGSPFAGVVSFHLQVFQLALPSQVVQEILGGSGGSSGTVARRNPAPHGM